MSSFNEQIEIDRQNAVDREDELAEAIENLAAEKMRKGGEFYPFSPDNFREALEECTDYEELHKAVLAAEECKNSSTCTMVYIKLMDVVKNYMHCMAMDSAYDDIESRTK